MSAAAGSRDKHLYMVQEGTYGTMEESGYSEPGIVRKAVFGNPDLQLVEEEGLGVAGTSSIVKGPHKAMASMELAITADNMWAAMICAALGNGAATASGTASQLEDSQPGYDVVQHRKVGTEYVVNAMGGAKISKLTLGVDYEAPRITLATDLMGLYVQQNIDGGVDGLSTALSLSGFYGDTDLSGCKPSPLTRTPLTPEIAKLYYASGTAGDATAVGSKAFDISYTGADGKVAELVISAAKAEIYLDGVLDTSIGSSGILDFTKTTSPAMHTFENLCTEIETGDYSCDNIYTDTSPWPALLIPQRTVIPASESSVDIHYLPILSASSVHGTEHGGGFQISVDRALEAKAGPYTGGDSSVYHIAHASMDPTAYNAVVEATTHEVTTGFADGYYDQDDYYLAAVIRDSPIFIMTVGPCKIMEAPASSSEPGLTTQSIKWKNYGGEHTVGAYVVPA